MKFLLRGLGCLIVIISSNPALELCRDVGRSDSFQVQLELILAGQKEIGEHFQILLKYNEKYTLVVTKYFM